MNDDERDIRALLESEAERAPHPKGLHPATVRRGMGRRIGTVALPLVVAASVAWVAVAGPFSSPPEPPVVGPGPGAGDGRIVFSRSGQSGGIMTMNADGSGARVISPTDYAAMDGAAWSPDGTKIAFHGFFGEARNQAGGLFVMNDDGSGLQMLALGGDMPTWSPDGTDLAFYKGGTLLIVSLEGGEQNSFIGVEGEFPDWSPDGKNLAFTRDNLYVVSVEGGRSRALNEPSWADIPAHPQWSPDGSRIAFTSYSDEINNGIPLSRVMVIDVAGGEEQLVAEGLNPTWSPDGTRIAFERPEGTNASHIYSINVDGSDERQLTFGEVADHSPDWGPPASSEPDCPPIGEHGYRFTAEPAPSEPGSTVMISGPVPMFGEGEQYIPPGPEDRLHVWFDVKNPEDWATNLIESQGSPNPRFEADTHPEDGTYLGSVDLSDPTQCTYRFEVTVPDVPPGEYTMVGVLFGGDGAVFVEGKSLKVGSAECPPIDIASDEYGVSMWQTWAYPGTDVLVAGTTLRGEDGGWVPSDRIELWWNTNSPGGEALRDGPVVKLGEVSEMSACFFETDFRVPQVDPGNYEISAFVFHAAPGESYGRLGKIDFEIPEPNFGPGQTGYQVNRGRITNYTDGGYLLLFDATWIGEGDRQAETCWFTIFDEAGDEIVTGSFKLDEEGRNIEQPFDAPPGSEPSSLEATCSGSNF